MRRGEGKVTAKERTWSGSQSVWIDPWSRWQKRILLHGIRTIPSTCDCHNGEHDPVIPHIGELVALSEQFKDSFEFQWDGDKWIRIMPNINQN